MEKEVFKYSWTVLNSSVIVLELWLFIYGITHWKQLNSYEGWGMLGIIIFAIIVGSCLFIDFVLQLLISNRRALNIIEMIVLAFLVIMFFTKIYI
ncbi:hypothetical protein [Pontimicrobium sp. SW4]|uniref:Uncharacterized protein n=1 Tax=Pontimicrobium sp. SW4 TaxID=3153519 RepID=A0AAU7BWS5_9FLAO